MLKETRKQLEAEADLLALASAVEQFLFFYDNGTAWEKTVATNYLANKLAQIKESKLKREND